MKKPNPLIGYVDYDGIRFPFRFDEEKFTIMLFPPTEETWAKTSAFEYVFEGLQFLRGHGWIQSLDLRGVTSERNNVLFHVAGDRSNTNGFLSFDVYWYFYYTTGLDPEKIHGFDISGQEVNFFFPPQEIIKPSIQFQEDGKTVSQMALTLSPAITKLCGKYRVARNTDAQIEVCAYSTVRYLDYTNPANAYSTMEVNFSKPVNLDVLINTYNQIYHFLKYITYRNNVAIEAAEVFGGGNGKNNDYGLLVFKPRYSMEMNKNASDRVIDYSVLRERTARLITAIKNNKIDFQYLCDSIDGTRHYPASRIMMILTEFEREYHNIYGTDSGRSSEYVAVKNDIVSKVAVYAETQHGRRRKYARQLEKYLEARDNSYELNLNMALCDCKAIMEPFVIRKYNSSKESYEKIASKISERMGIIRNGLAHSRLDLRFEAIHLVDIKVVEELIYAIRLKYIGVKPEDAQRAIGKLFGDCSATYC